MTTTVADRPRTRRKSYDIVVLTASAGGLEAVSEIVRALPRDFPVPIIAVLHHAPGRTPMLLKILRSRTRLHVIEAVDGQPLDAGHVYLAPSVRHMLVTPQHTISSMDERKINYRRSSAEPLLDSLREEYGPHAIAVILSGSGRNGAVAAKALRDAGGLVIAQDRATSLNFGMPGAAIAIGAVDHVLPIRAIAPALVQLTKRGT